MKRSRSLCGALLIAALVVPACKQIEETSARSNPATIAETAQEGISSVTLTQQAVVRLGIATVAVGQVRSAGATLKTIPYGAVIYDHAAKPWTYTNPEPLVYVRHAITIASIDGDTVLLTEGPPAGTRVVTVGAAMLFGAELGIGK
ncbi:MAG: hypothetical protein ACRDJ1_01475 [Actinomycetota bacterium]